jgi:pilus assembly protein FimV
VKKIITGKTSMQKLFRLCLWQVILGLCTAGAFSISMLSTSGSAFSQEIPTQERGIRMRGPKSTDAFPYDRYGPITQTDTLWKIALTVRPDSRLSVYQVMEALYQANPNSFVNNNLNHLVQGQYLKIPSFDRMMSVNTTVAKQKSRQDDKDWQKKQPKKVKTPKVPSVNKKDLDTVKVEINDQLQKIDNEQQKRLENIQNDVLDSIDGLQAILKENENLRQRLTSFNNQLGTMQKEVAKGKEIKLQMDDMIRLQQALLEKAQSREQELLLEKQQAALEKDNVFSSLWFIVLMATLPAILILLAVAFIFKRRKTETINSESVPKKKSKGKPENIINEPKDEIDEIDELSLDDDLSIDLLDEEGKSEDDVIHLDDDDEDDLGDLDDLDDLDDLEDILLDDDELEGGELGQDDLDSLLMEDDAIEEEENDALVDNQLDQSDLDDLLGDLGDDEFEIEDEDFSSKDELDIDDALLESMAIDEAPAVKKESSKADDDAQTEMSDPDDIDALLESMAADEGPLEEAAVVEEESVEEASSKADDDAQTEISDPDDIDALLESMATDETPAVEEESVEEASSKADDADDGQTEMSDPDDIDALLASMDVEGSDDDDNSEEEAVNKEEVKQEESQNKAKIESLTEEYVAPLLAADFSDLLAKSTKEDLTGIDTSQDDLVDDDFDIDALIADIENNTTDQNLIQDTEFDIGDDLAEGAFDEESLAELLNDEEAAVELSPDFSDQNVLADLLNDENNDKSQVSEATEINDIQELDSLDFDELLANIEEESSVASQSVDFNENLDVGDDFSLAEFDNISSNTHSNANKKTTKGEESFLSVDSLLSESQDEVSRNEPYDKSNIDVGLNEFPEFTNGVNKIDVDLDENGMAAKLDLAKVYIEIGDQDNAQVILQEVIKQGDNQQQVVAQELLDNL